MVKSQKNIFKGLKVVEFASVLAGPSVGMFFAELGASVIKVENKNTGGDITRQWKLPSEKTNKKISAYYASVNWKKKSVFLDLKNKADQKKAYGFIERADVVITNNSLSTLKKIGMEYKKLKAINPLLIHANLTGYGEKDEKPAFDVILQAETGYMSMNGTDKTGPLKMPVALIDVLAAHQLKEAVLIALLQKQKMGKGAYISVSLFDSAVASLVNQASNWLMAGYLPGLAGSFHPNIAPYGETFITKDNKWLVLAIGNDTQFKKLCKVLLLGNSMPDKLFGTNQLRVKNRRLLYKKLMPYFSKLTCTEILKKFNKERIPAAECKDLRNLFRTPYVKKMLLLDSNGGKRVKSAVFNIK